MALYVGIDLGTTETTVSVIEILNNRENPLDKLTTINIYQMNENFEFDRNSKGLQSSIYIDRDNRKIYTGAYAKYLYGNGTYPLQTIRSVKTRMGTIAVIDVPKLSNNSDIKSYGMTELSAILLKTVYNSLVERFNTNNFNKVTVTIPAAFNSDERNATIHAMEIAGFSNPMILDEPTAVLLNFINTIGNESNKFDNLYFEQAKKVVVYDIGGGTLDISIANVHFDIDENDFDINIIGRSKRMDFGGDNIDQAIASYFLDQFNETPGNQNIDQLNDEDQAKMIAKAVYMAEKFKIDFNNGIIDRLNNPRMKERFNTTVNFELLNGRYINDLEITDKLLKNKILTNLLSDQGNLIKPLKDSLINHKINRQDIDLFIFTGGSSKFYLVKEVLSKFFQNTQVEFIDFSKNNAVSQGASMHSYNQEREGLTKIKLSDIMADSIWIRKDNSFDKFIPNDTAPNSKGIYNYHFSEYQNRIDLFLYYGSDGEAKYLFREIGGVFLALDRYYEPGESLKLNWTLDKNKTVKVFWNNRELVNTEYNKTNHFELINNFSLNPIR